MPEARSLADIDPNDDGQMVIGKTETLSDIGGDTRWNVEGEAAGAVGKSRSSTCTAY